METTRRIPQPIRTLAQACEGFYSSRGIRKAKWRLYYELAALGWEVDVTEPKRDGDTYTRAPTPALMVKSPTPIAIEVAKLRGTLAQLERLKRADGLRVLVLIWADVVRPWEQRRASWGGRRPTMGDLAGIDCIIAAGTKPPMVYTPDALARDHEAELVEQARCELARQVALEALILGEVRKAWHAWAPVSCHANVEPHRHLPTALKVWGYSESETKRAVKQLIEQQKLGHGKHRKSLLRGLAITDKMSDPIWAPDNPHMPSA